MKSPKRHFDPQVFLAKVGAGKTIVKYRKGRIIYAQGEEADRIFYIQSGAVKVTVVSEQGKEAVVALLDAGDFFGEIALLAAPRRTSSVETTSPMRAGVMTAANFRAMIREFPHVAEKVRVVMEARMNRTGQAAP